MKTTVDLPDDLIVRAKKRAAETRTSLRTLIARGLRRELDAGRSGTRTRKGASAIHWVTSPGGLPPGLDVANREALHEWSRTRS